MAGRDAPQSQPAQMPAGPQAPAGISTAVRFDGVPTTGALFATMGGARHFRTAAVVKSTAGDLVLTAAHCVDAAGFAASVEYIPGVLRRAGVLRGVGGDYEWASYSPYFGSALRALFGQAEKLAA